MLFRSGREREGERGRDRKGGREDVLVGRRAADLNRIVREILTEILTIESEGVESSCSELQREEISGKQKNEKREKEEDS